VPTESVDARGGWHWVEWGCEFVGTALLLVGGLSAVCLTMGAHSEIRTAIPSEATRLLLTGLLFAGTGSLMAISPWGRRSGAHLNPAVTLAFWLQHKVHPHDVAGYVVAQLLGALAGATVVVGLWRGTARGLGDGATTPGRGFGDVAALGTEALMTAALVLMILLLTSSARTARWTPLGNLLLVAALVWQVAPYTGTSVNPARSFGPALLAPKLAPYWVYVVGPLAGSLLACGAFALMRARTTQTAKIFHDPRYPSTLGSTMPVAPQRRT
jgi:aquaporin Z